MLIEPPVVFLIPWIPIIHITSPPLVNIIIMTDYNLLVVILCELSNFYERKNLLVIITCPCGKEWTACLHELMTNCITSTRMSTRINQL